MDVVFAYPGGASMNCINLSPDQKIPPFTRQEQGGGFMAHGYARATGKAGVCMATSDLVPQFGYLLLMLLWTAFLGGNNWTSLTAPSEKLPFKKLTFE